MGQSGLMMAGYGVQGLSSLGSAYSQATAAKVQADYQKQQYETNARLADMASDDATRRGDKAAEEHGKVTVSVSNSARAAAAAQGIDVDQGSSAQIQSDIQKMGALDVNTIKNNAWREAWGYRVNANDLRGRGAMAGMAGDFTSKMTMLTGGMKFLQAGMAGSGEYFKDHPATPDNSGPAPGEVGKRFRETDTQSWLDEIPGQ
jgi:hypothetical protein